MQTNEQKEIEKIATKYRKGTKKENRLEAIRTLDGKVRKAFLLPLCILGTIGALTLGSGMALYLTFGLPREGICVGILGVLLCSITYPIANKMKMRKMDEVRDEILKLAKENM